MRAGARKMFGGEEDKEIDRLLKARARGIDAFNRSCAGFDPDRATAFLEQKLNEPEQTAYSDHLIRCRGCRVAIVRLAELDGASAAAPYAALSAGLPSQKTVSGFEGRGRRSGLGSWISGPQWAAVAAATVIAIISVSLVIRFVGHRGSGAASPGMIASTVKGSAPDSSNPVGNGNAGHNDVASAARTAPSDSSQPSSPSGSSIRQPSDARAQSEDKPAEADNLVAVAAAPPTSVPEAKDGASTESRRAEGRESASEQDNQPAGSSSAPATVVKSTDAEGAGKPSENARSSAASPSGDSTAKQADRADKKDAALAKLDPDKALRLNQDDEKTKVSVLKHGTEPDQPQPSKEKVATIKPQDSVAPTPAPSQDDSVARGRRAIAGPPAKEFVSENKPAEEAHFNHDAVTTPSKLTKGERRVEGKKFRLLNGIWTDRGFKPDKEMPSVTLVRDSAVYNALLAKEDALRTYLSGFAPSERAIIVYKKIVYKLVPASPKN